MKEGLRKLKVGIGNLQGMREVGTNDFFPFASLFYPTTQGQLCTEKYELGRQTGVFFPGNIRATTGISMRKQASVSTVFTLQLVGISYLRLI